MSKVEKLINTKSGLVPVKLPDF